MFNKLYEIAYFPKLSANAIYYVDHLTVVGSYTDDNGLLWKVVKSTDIIPYIVAYRLGYADFKGAFLYHNYFAYLRTQSLINGNEWVNGVGYGVEPLSGSGSLTLDSYNVTYS